MSKNGSNQLLQKPNRTSLTINALDNFNEIFLV